MYRALWGSAQGANLRLPADAGSARRQREERLAQQVGNVLLGAAGTGTSFAMAVRLRAVWGEKLRIIGIDTNPAHLVATSLLCDRFHTVPPVTSEGFLSALSTIIVAEEIGTYVPVLNDEVLLTGELVDDVRWKGVDIIKPNKLGIRLAADKLALAHWANSIGIAAPETFLPGQRTGSGPWFMKPRNGFGSRRARTVQLEDLTEINNDDVIMQEVCEPPEITVDSFFDYTADEGFVVCRERLEVKAGICTKARIFFDSEIEEFAKKIGHNIEQRGTICFQLMRAKGQWVVTDLNVRPGAGTSMTVAAGYDVLAAQFACRWGEDWHRFFATPRLQRDLFVTRQYCEFVMNG